jgi:hypothetical protein
MSIEADAAGTVRTPGARGLGAAKCDSSTVGVAEATGPERAAGWAAG